VTQVIEVIGGDCMCEGETTQRCGARVKCELRVAKLRVGILRVEVRAKGASSGVKCEMIECARRLLKDRR